MSANEEFLCFSLPMLPPSVNHYIDHGRGHRLTPAAKAWKDQFLSMLPARIRGGFVTGERFFVVLTVTPGPGDRGDIDNYPKLILDCIEADGMFRNRRGYGLSDAHVKRLRVHLDDQPEERANGPRLDVFISAL